MLDGIFRRRRLPHWDVDDGTYFVTSCLEGSLPAQGIAELNHYRDELEARERPQEFSPEEWRLRIQKLVFARFDAIIDLQPAVKHLAAPSAATIVQNAMLHFAGDRYDLLAFVVMPSHYHWVFHPRRVWVDALNLRHTPSFAPRSRVRTPRERIMQSLNGFTANQCNRLLELTGTFWQGESYDHVVRDEEELMRIIAYVEQNPVKAGLVSHSQDWRWSSAAYREKHGIAPGGFLV